jgi:hypothetical protein
MGDRTSVQLTVLYEHSEKALALLKESYEEPEETNIQHDFFFMHFEDVNYGFIEGLDEFIKAGIPYSVEAGLGASYGESEEHLRYLEDGSFELRKSEQDWPENTISNCVKAIKEAQEKGTVDALAVLVSLLNAASTPSWDNQAVLSKQYLATQLINPQQ